MTGTGSGLFNGFINRCLWLPSYGGSTAAGWLLCKGWFYVAGHPVSVALDFERAEGEIPRNLNFVPVSLPRPDVIAVYPDVPLQCGFDLILPVLEFPRSGIHPFLIFRVNDATLKFPIDEIEDASQPEALAAKYVLDAARQKKLENLLLNEAERLDGSTLKRSQPISLYIDPTFGCNLDCPHCLSKMLRDQHFHRKSLKPDQLEAILNRYGDTLIRVTLALWGEPLLNKRFAEIVGLCKRHSLFCETSTNLSLPLSEAAIDDIVRSGLDEMRLSIDGATQDTYARYRVNGNLDLVLRNVGRLIAAKCRFGSERPRLRWQYLLFPWNAHEKDAAAALARDLGVDEFYCFPGDPWSEPPSPGPRTDKDDGIAVPDAGRSTHENMSVHGRNYAPTGCDFLDHTLAIHSDGTVFPCCYRVAPKDALGAWSDLQPDPFNSPRLVKLREFVGSLRAGPTIAGPSPCASCGALTRGHVEDHLDFWTALQLVTMRL
jgi:MoaA/NifB/PqqE/SkfB family radical SAM enzyme